MLDAWSHTTVDLRRLKRLFGGACAAAMLLGVAGYGAANAVHDPAPEVVEEEKEKIVEVALVETPPEEEEAPVEEEPASAEPMPVARAAPPVVTQVREVPKNLPPPGPADPYGADAPAPYFGDGTPGAGGPGPVKRVPKRKPLPPPTATARKAEPAKKKEEKVETDPPKCQRRGIDRGRAKAMNVEGKVMVTYTVDASGAVVNVTAKSGPAELRPLAISAVQSWRCEPARRKSDGGAVAVTKTVPLTVTLQ